MLIAFSVGNVWAVDYDLVYTLDGTLTNTGGNSNYAQAGDDVVQSDIHWSVTGNLTQNPWRIGGKNLDNVDREAYSKTAISDNIAKIEIEHGTKTLSAVNSMTVIVASNSDFSTVVSSFTPTFEASKTVTVTRPDGKDWSNCYYKIVYNVDAGSSNSYLQLKSVKLYKEKAASDPSLEADPLEVDFGTVELGASVPSETVEVTFANLTGDVTYSGLTTPFGASGTISSTGDAITISADASAAGTFEQTLTIESAADSKSVEVTVKMKVAAPTGTFELFSGDIEEGDYVLVSTNALSNSVNNSRLASQAVTISEDKIVNPDAAIIWHIAPVGETSYWTLYNEAVSKYAGGTTSKNQGALLADVTDYAKWTITEGTNVYEFVNLGRETGSSDTGNKYLRYNSGNAENSRWACYGSGTGTAPALYKKADGKQNADLSYATAQYLIKKNASFTAQELTNPHDIAGISYASDNEAVAEVNASTGAVTIKTDATGVAKITASFGGDASYRSGSASYTIFVAEQAGTAEDPLTEASAKALIDLGCTLNAHVNGLVLSQNSTTFTVTLTNGFQFYKAKDLGDVAFESAYLGAGDEVTAVGALKKFSSTYELDEGCYLTYYEAATTPLTPIANDEASAYTVAQALEFAANPTTYDLSDIVYVRGKVAIASTALFSNKYLTYSISDDGTTTSVLKVYNGLGIDGAAFTSKDDILVGDVVVVKGNLTQFNTELEFAANNELVSKKPVATIAIDNMELEYAEVATISATITPAAAASTVVYSIKAGSDDVITLSGDQITAKSVTGTATIVATIAGTDDYEGATKEFTVSVAEADTRKIANSPAEFEEISGNMSPADITFAAYKGGAGNDPFITSGKALRLYQKSGSNTFGGFITLTAKAGCTIDEVQITTTSAYSTSVAYSVDGNATLSESESVTASSSYTTGTGLNASSVNILNLGSGSSGRLEIASIKVYYTGEPATIDHYELGGTYQTAFVQNEEFNHTGLIVYAAYDALGELKVDITSMCTFSDPDMSTTGEKTIEITYNEAVVTSYTINVAADSRKVADSPATFTTVSGDMTPNDITFASYQGGAGTAPANYNDGIRLYQAPSADAIGGFITLKAKKGCTIDQVKITTTNSYATTVAYSVDGNENLLGSESVAKSSDYSTPSGLNVESVNIVNKGTGSSGRLEIASIKVWYTGDALAVDHYILGGTYETVFEQYGTFSYEGLTVTAAYDAGETITEAVTGFTVEADLNTAGEKKANVMLNSVKIAEYDITVTASAKEDPALAYIPASVILTLGQSLTAPTFSNDHNVSPITYSSDKPAVATVDPEGNIALAGGCGTAVITASFAGDDDYIDSEATFTITVNEPAEDLTGPWTLASTVAAGDKIIIGATKDANTYAMGKQNSNNRAAVASTLEGATLTPGAATKVFTLVDAGEGKFAILASNGKYLTSATSGSSNNLLEADNYDLDNAKWTISIDGEGIASVVAAAGSKTVMQYNSQNTIFSCYGSDSQTDINIYKKDVPVKDLIRGGLGYGKWGTLCPAQNVEQVEGAEFFLLSYLEEKDGLPYNVVFDEIIGPNLEAGKPYFFIANADEIRGYKTGAVLDAAGDGVNGFYGYIGASSMELTVWHNAYDEDEDNTFVIHNNKVVRINQEGTMLPSERCYININKEVPSRTAVAKTYGRRRITMSVNNKDQAQGFENIESGDAPMKVMIEGTLYIIRGEKVFDATGRLVK